MARNLVKNNYEVLVFDLSPEAVKSVTDAGQLTAFVNLFSQ